MKKLLLLGGIMLCTGASICQAGWLSDTLEGVGKRLGTGRLFGPVFFGVWAAAIGLAPSFAAKAVLAAPAVLIPLVWWTLRTPARWLAALTLLGISVWLWRTGRPMWYALLPACFMLAT